MHIREECFLLSGVGKGNDQIWGLIAGGLGVDCGEQVELLEAIVSFMQTVEKSVEIQQQGPEQV
jgi:hypothetical protein